jgi:hypothetical protein
MPLTRKQDGLALQHDGWANALVVELEVQYFKTPEKRAASI